MKLDIVDNPLTLSLIIYVFIAGILYMKKKDMFKKEDNQNNENNKNDTFFNRNSGLLFVLMPIIIYGFVSGMVNTVNRTKYCSLLKKKEVNIQELLKQCKK